MPAGTIGESSASPYMSPGASGNARASTRSSAEPNRHYIAYTDIGFSRSPDAGRTWFWQTGRPLRNTTYELAFDPAAPGKIWAAFADLHDIPNNNVISGRHYRAQASGGVG